MKIQYIFCLFWLSVPHSKQLTHLTTSRGPFVVRLTYSHSFTMQVDKHHDKINFKQIKFKPKC